MTVGWLLDVWYVSIFANQSIIITGDYAGRIVHTQEQQQQDHRKNVQHNPFQLLLVPNNLLLFEGANNGEWNIEFYRVSLTFKNGQNIV